MGLVQVRDHDALERWIDEALAANPRAVEEALRGARKAKRAIGFLRGQVMRVSSGQADPKEVRTLLEQRLARLRGKGDRGD
jgi:aspartyl-tRNA(Asn)/glutamyl-tRNA(Gln) amidotransferase subunit B